MSAFGFSLIFAVNALVFGIGAGASIKSKTPRQSTFFGSVGLLAFSVALLLAMLVGAIIFVLGGVVSPLVGMGDIVVSTSLIFVVCGVLALGFCLRFMQLDDTSCQ